MIAFITLASRARLDHLRRQQQRMARRHPDVARVVVWLDADPAPEEVGAAAEVVHVPPGAGGMRLAAGRNAGAGTAIASGADLLIFLDADCLPGDSLVGYYQRAATEHPRAICCGPVSYLPEGVIVSADAELASLTDPHPARPAPADGAVHAASPEDYPLFWSLSFAMTADGWQATGGFHTEYAGYGGEDTDFAFAARGAGIPMLWVGGAHAYHQYHPTSQPPWQHLDDILRNGRLFSSRWGSWPMKGWLTAFAEAGAIERTAEGWARTGS